MPLKDLSGKTVYDLDREDFEKLFCRQCRYYRKSPACFYPSMVQINGCKRLVDCGAWDRLYRKQLQIE